MDIVTTSLDALLHKATNTHTQKVDIAAVEAFCALINKEKDGPQIGTKLLATSMHSKREIEALNTLAVLDICMTRCNNAFQSEVGKFRFLNEMIKLVSPKYMGSHTLPIIKQKVLQLLYVWTLDYPKETKIKEAYDMLKKQGVIREVPLSVCADGVHAPERKLIGNSVFQDEEKNRLLQKLLQSKNPDDLQAANRLIKSMVKEDDKRAEIKSRKITEVESATNNVRLLNEMLDSYKPDVSSRDELDLIKELQQTCEKLRPKIYKLISETPQNEEILSDVLQASDELSQVFNKYTEIIVKGNIPDRSSASQDINSQNHSLLDLELNLNQEVSCKTTDKNCDSSITSSDMDLLCDVFTNTTSISKSILTPTVSTLSTASDYSLSVNKAESFNVKKSNALDDLDALGEHLLNENLSRKKEHFNNKWGSNTEKVPLNVLVQQSAKSSSIETVTKNSSTTDGALCLDLNYLIDKNDNPNNEDESQEASLNQEDSSNDDVLVDIVEEENQDSEITNDDVNKSYSESYNVSKTCVKLNDLVIKLEDVRPSAIPPLTVLDQEKGISVTLHFAKNKPREDVEVIVVTTVSRYELPISNLLFQAVVPKSCKLKLLPPSAANLPAFNPFLPPSAITQIMLIANPQKVEVSLKFIVSYVIDEETLTEMGDIESLPWIKV